MAYKRVKPCINITFLNKTKIIVCYTFFEVKKMPRISVCQPSGTACLAIQASHKTHSALLRPLLGLKPFYSQHFYVKGKLDKWLVLKDLSL